MDGRGVDEMIVVQHEDAPVGQLHEVVEQERQQRLERRRLRRPQQRERCGADGWDDGLERGDEVAQELKRVGVARIQGKPGNMAADTYRLIEPVDEQGSLAKPGGAAIRVSEP